MRMLLIAALVSGCASSPLSSPSLLKKTPSPETPVILIPGTTRTKLIDTKTGMTVWGNLFTFLGKHRETALALPIDGENLENNVNHTGPGELLDEIAIIPRIAEMQLYTRFLRAMKNGGYRLGSLSNPKPGENFFIFTYDWRLPHDVNARLLAAKIENLQSVLGPQAQKVDVIAHSSAVLIARYYALYGSRDITQESDPVPDNSGARNIRKLILVNPAHQGLVFAFRILHEGFRPVHGVFMRRFTPYEIFTHPAFFMMMPRYDLETFVGQNGRAVPISLYDADNWVRYGWSVFSEDEQRRLEKFMRKRFPLTWQTEMERENKQMINYLRRVLARAVLIQKAVSEKLHRLPDTVETYVFVTEWGPTPERVCLELPEGKVHFEDGECGVELKSEGDHLVTSSSLRGNYIGPVPRYIFLKEEHRRIANNRKFHEHALRILRGEE